MMPPGGAPFAAFEPKLAEDVPDPPLAARAAVASARTAALESAREGALIAPGGRIRSDRAAHLRQAGRGSGRGRPVLRLHRGRPLRNRTGALRHGVALRGGRPPGAVGSIMTCRFGTICRSFAARDPYKPRRLRRPIRRIWAVLAGCGAALGGVAPSRRATEDSP